MSLKSKFLIFLLSVLIASFIGALLIAGQSEDNKTVTFQNQNVGVIKTPLAFKKDIWPIFGLSEEEKKELLRIAMEDERVKKLLDNKSFEVVQIAKFIKYPSGEDLGFAAIYIRLNYSEFYTIIMDLTNKTVKSIKSSFEAR